MGFLLYRWYPISIPNGNAIKLAGIVNSQPRKRYVKITSPKINLWQPKLDKFMVKVKL